MDDHWKLDMKNIFHPVKFSFEIMRLITNRSRRFHNVGLMAPIILLIVLLMPHIVLAHSEKLDCSKIFPVGVNLTKEESCQALNAIGLDYDSVSGKLFFHNLHFCGPVNFSAKYAKLSLGDERYILIITGNACTSGIAGSEFYLLEIKRHQFYKIADVASISRIEISKKINNFHNVLFLYGPGKCHAAWVWENGAYRFNENICK